MSANYCLTEKGEVWKIGDGLSDHTVVESGVIAMDGNLVVKEDGSLWVLDMKSHSLFGLQNPQKKESLKVWEKDVVDVFRAKSHILFLKSDGTLWGTGSNDYGQLGHGGVDRESWFKPVHLDLQASPVNDSRNYYFEIDGNELKLARSIRHMKQEEFDIHVLGVTEEGQRLEKRFTIEVEGE